MRRTFSLRTMSRVKIGIGAAWVAIGSLQLLHLPGLYTAPFLVVALALMVWDIWCVLGKRVEAHDEMSLSHRQEADSLTLLLLGVTLAVTMLAVTCAGSSDKDALMAMSVSLYDARSVLMVAIGVIYLIPGMLFNVFEGGSGEYAED